MLWTLAVLAVLQSKTVTTAWIWVIMVEMVACFMPAVFYHFVAYFPRDRFEGNGNFLKALYVTAVLLAALAPTPLYVQEVKLIVPGQPPQAIHGPVYWIYWVYVFIAVLAMHRNLRRKLRQMQGHARRQTQFVMFGLYTIAALAAITNFSEIIVKVRVMQAYGPISTILLMSVFAYAMIRYHLLDTRAIVSKLTVLFISSGFVIGVVTGTVALYRWLEKEPVAPLPLLPIVAAAAILALSYHAVRERVQRFVEGSLLRQRYDINRLFTRMAEQAAEALQMDPLLHMIASDIQKTIGVETIRVWLVDEKDRSLLVSRFSTVEEEPLRATRRHAPLLDYLREDPKPLLLEKLLHQESGPRMQIIAEHLAELDAYFCLPLRTSSGVIGLLTLGQKNNRDPYSRDELVAFHALAGPLGTAIMNARLYDELESVNLHLSEVFAHMREGVVAVNTAGVVTTVNEAAAKIIGDIKVGQPLDSLTQDVAEILRRTLELERGISDFETTLRAPGREPVPVVMSSSCLKSVESGTTGAVALLYDLTQVKRLEQNVLRADRLSSIGTLAAGMAHEIKNPLVSIKTFSQLLKTRYQDPDFRTTFRDVVPQEVDRIDAIVSRLLDFARPRPVTFEPENIRTIIEDVLALVENQTRKNLVSVTMSFPDEDIYVNGDEQQLHQVFLNLVLNALDAMKETDGGSLHIEVEPAHVHLRRHGMLSVLETECARVRITDTGCGIHRENIPNLFTPFYTTKSNGCGLGLAVVHGIVSEHGGEIDVESVVGKGTTFTVDLPLARALTSARPA